MQRLIECVPNFSEGRDQGVLDAIAAAVRAVSGVELLDVDPGADTHRTVFTFVGSPEQVIEAAYQAIKVASSTIDMRVHQGAHPRIGATDVCPLIPLEGVTVDECVALARSLGDRVARELAIPVYLYEKAATRPERSNLASIRAGEYEGLEKKLVDPVWQPDFPAPYNARSGATVIGVRDFLIAYNVNLNTPDKRLAHDIALTIREAGRIMRDAYGEPVLDEAGATRKAPGLLKAVKAVGWYIEAYQQAQVSINLTDFATTPPHVVFDVICAEASKRGLRVTGSELVGLIPLQAMLAAGRHYCRLQGRSDGESEEELIAMAVRSLGLDQLGPFDPQQKIIEYRFRRLAGPLASMSLRGFCNVLASDAPAPGGGSAAALGGALASSLVGMVANLTANSPGVRYARARGEHEAFERMEALARSMQEHKDRAISNIDEDTAAFDAMMAARRVKASTPHEEGARQAGIDAATLRGIEVPMQTLRAMRDVARAAGTAAEHGLAAAASDAGCGAAMAEAAARSAYYNVCINLQGLGDVQQRDALAAEARTLLDDVVALAAEVARRLEIVLALPC